MKWPDWFPDPNDPDTLPSRRFGGPPLLWALLPWLALLAVIGIVLLLVKSLL